MTPTTQPADRLDATVDDFHRNGFVVIPDALSPAQVAALNSSFTRYETEFPDEWSHFSESFIHTADVLPHMDAFDATIENPVKPELPWGRSTQCSDCGQHCCRCSRGRTANGPTIVHHRVQFFLQRERWILL